MKIVLVNPPIRYSMSPLPPLGIAYLAAVLRDAGYQDISIIDGAAMHLQQQDVVNQIISEKPDVVGFSVMSNVQDAARRLSADVRRFLPKTRICWGGAHATAMPQQSLSSGVVDTVFRHEAEASFLEYIRLLESGGDVRTVKGTCFLDQNRTIVNERAPRVRDLDSLPLPARDLLPMDRYATASWFSDKVKRATTIISSRGCPYECTYCANQVSWGDRRHIRRDPCRVVDEMEMLVKDYGYTGFQFSDECLTANREHITRFCAEILDRGLKVSWVCSSTVRNVSREILDMMKRAGCEFVNYGVESGSPGIRERLKKRISNDEIFSAVAATKSAGLRVGCCFLLGSPGETVGTARETIRMAQRLAPDDVAFNIVVPFPGTEIYEEIVAPLGLNLNWDEAMGFDPLRPDLPKIFYNCSSLPDAQLISLYREARRKVELSPLALGMVWNRLRHVSSFKHFLVVVRGGLRLLYKR